MLFRSFGIEGAPSLSIIQALQDAGAHVRAFDPEGMDMARTMMGDIDYAKDAYDVASGADCLVLVTEWNAFRSLDLGRIKSLMKHPCLVDLRNVYRGKEVEAHGFTYTSIGRPKEDVKHKLKAVGAA